MDLKVYQATSEDVAAIAEKLPVGRLYANGRGWWEVAEVTVNRRELRVFQVRPVRAIVILVVQSFKKQVVESVKAGFSCNFSFCLHSSEKFDL